MNYERYDEIGRKEFQKKIFEKNIEQDKSLSQLESAVKKSLRHHFFKFP